MHTVHLRITDAATKKPTPVRLSVTDPAGTFFAPFGRVVDFAAGKNEDVGGHLRVGRDRFVYVDGSCEIRLPAGVPLRVRATKGPEFTSLDTTVTLGPGQMALRFGVTRWSDIRADGWHPGDTRVHTLPPHAAALEAAAEDVTVVNLLARAQPFPSLDGTAYQSVSNMTAFSGQQAALRTEAAVVAVNTLNVHPVLGRVGLLHSHRPVFPLTSGGPDEFDDWSLCDWCDQCHRKNGLTVWANPFDGVAAALGGEALVALILGKIDAIEFDGGPRKSPLLPWWYRLLEAGFPVPLVGGSGKESNAVPLGTPRTYARLNPREPLTYTAWVGAVRAGRCFATNGPILRFDVDGRGPGEHVDLAALGQSVRCRASAASLDRFDQFELVVGSRVVASAPAAMVGERWSAGLELDLPVSGSGWVAARCTGDGGSVFNPGHLPFAHTSPVYLRVNDAPLPRRPSAIAPLRRAVEQAREWVDTYGRFSDGRRKEQRLALFDAAIARLANEPTTNPELR